MSFIESYYKKLKRKLAILKARYEFKKLTGYKATAKQEQYFMGKALGYIFTERREGKTTAVIATALHHASLGKLVLIVVSSEQQAQFTRGEIKHFLDRNGMEAQFKNNTFYFPKHKVSTIEVWPAKLLEIKRNNHQRDVVLYDFID